MGDKYQSLLSGWAKTCFVFFYTPPWPQDAQACQSTFDECQWRKEKMKTHSLSSKTVILKALLAYTGSVMQDVL